MKTINYLTVVLLSLLFVSCSSSSHLVKLNNGRKIDTRLVGKSVGSETDQQYADTKKSWIMEKNADGTFILTFTVTQNGQTSKWQETGNWWVEKNIYHEFHDESGLTDQYYYTVLNEKQIKYKSKSVGVEMNTDTYEFIDTKITD